MKKDGGEKEGLNWLLCCALGTRSVEQLGLPVIPQKRHLTFPRRVCLDG
jgi:hypothetical protein